VLLAASLVFKGSAFLLKYFTKENEAFHNLYRPTFSDYVFTIPNRVSLYQLHIDSKTECAKPEEISSAGRRSL